MTPLHCQATATVMLLAAGLPAVSALVPSLSIRQIQSVRSDSFRKRGTELGLAIDPTDLVSQHAHLMHQQHGVDPASALDAISSSLTLAKANAMAVVPNQSLAPLSETIRSAFDGSNGNMVEVIPDMPSMPGGAPRSGSAFLSESFKDLYDGVITTPSKPFYGADVSADGSTVVIPPRELDVVARYADLLNRVPLAAAVYALFDFFVINAEEDVAIAELLDDDEEQVRAILDVEKRVMVQRFWGLSAVVAVTIAWSLLTYHPVPFGEL